MNFSLDIFAKEKELKNIDVKEMLVSWGGEEFSRTPPQYIYKEKLIFKENVYIEYYKKHYNGLIGSDFNIDNYLSIRLLGNNMIDLIYNINMNFDEAENNSIMKFLFEVSKLSSFAIFIEDEDDDMITKKYIVNTYNEIVDIISYHLKWDISQGVLIIKKT